MDNEMIAIAGELLGRRYDPEKFTCWTLCEIVAGAPKVEHSAHSALSAIRNFEAEAYDRDGWKSISVGSHFKSGDILMFGHTSKVSHAGVYMNDAVLHIEDNKQGVVHEKLGNILRRFLLLKAYRHVD